MAREPEQCQAAEAEKRRDLNVCVTCTHFEQEQEVPYCIKFKSWADAVVESCGGPY